MSMKPSGYNAYTTIHNGGIYKATIWRMSSEYPFELRVCYVDDAGMKHEEFCKSYKTASSAFGKLQRYFKGESAVWSAD